MKQISATGVYSLGACLTKELVFFKDNTPAIPYKEEYFRKFFDNLDDILLSGKPTKKIIGFQANYPCNEKCVMDYGHWELLLVIMLFSLIGEKVKDESKRAKIKDYFTCGDAPRFDWATLDFLWSSHIAGFTLEEFLKLPDEELDAVSKAVRPVAESAWEYTNCIDLGDDDKCLKVIETLLRDAYFMVVCAPDADTSLQTAASMYGSFIKLMDTEIANLEDGWQIYE